MSPRPLLVLSLATALLPATLRAADPGPRSGRDWPGFRGIGASGIGEAEAAPLAFDMRTGAGVGWRTKIPGLGHSSPAIWNDLLCVTSALSSGGRGDLKVGLYGDIEPAKDEAPQEWKVVSLDKKTGDLRWEKNARQGPPRVRRHPKATHANSSVAMDAKRVVAMFGTEGLYAYDHSGKLLWTKDLGPLDSGFFRVPEAQWGFGSSPVIHEGRLLV